MSAELQTFYAGAVVYAADLPLLGAFYRDVVGLAEQSRESDHVVLASPAFQLVIVKATPSTPGAVGAPNWRTGAAVKLAFAVADIPAARELLARQRGGELLPAEREWDFQGNRICDGCDPEGNVIQLRQATR